MKISYNNFINDLAIDLQENSKLEEIIEKFYKDYNLIPVVGVEIEFYLSPNIDIEKFEDFSSIIVKKEKGNNQFEVDLPPSMNLIKYIDDIVNVKVILEKAAKKLGGNINFTPKPFLNDYGNSMHFHINFLSIDPRLRGDDNSDDILNLATRGLCHYILDSFLVFMPNDQDYLRIDKNFMTPTHISFGGNNRTTLLRIPDSYPKRLEHRLASPDTNPYLAIFTILKSILLALQYPNILKSIDKTYGNAFDAQYNLTPLPSSAEESFKLFKLEFFMDSCH